MKMYVTGGRAPSSQFHQPYTQKKNPENYFTEAWVNPGTGGVLVVA
jgi:hypothetical protein